MALSLSYISLFFLAVFSFLPNLYIASIVTVDNNGYKGIVVAIHSRVPEDPEILENIKTLFSRASEFLHNSTKNTFFFKEVKIVVPPTWSWQPEYEILPGNFFSSSHVRVDTPNPEYKNTPYTVQPGGCGEHGQYIHLTPWFIKELHGKTVDMFGAPERQLIHEWAHLRYGVFDEYGMPGHKRYPMFYQENGKIRPTSCVRDIKGWIESRDGGPCTMTEDGEVDEDCIFIPNMHSNEAKASIMYMPFIPSMEGFCDDGEHKHNVYAPTKHNAVCNYKSTWDVIAEHQDFQNRVKRDATTELTETLFRVIQSPEIPTSRYVLVLDVSGSMNGQPMKMLHGAATRLVEDRISEGTYLGIVQFSTEASILHNLTRVDNTTRKQLSASLPAKDDGGTTAIGKGLQEAIKVLTYANGTAEGGLIMLITDGEENVKPFIEDILPEVLEHNVIINTVAFGSDASQKLENMTSVTGGRGYFFSSNGSRPASALDSAFLESITSQADIELQPVQLKDEMFTLDSTNLTKYVYMDKELGKETVFTITSPHINRVAGIILKSPTGIVIDSSHPYYNRDENIRQRIQISLPEAEPGRWEVIIRQLSEYPIVVGFAVTSEPKDIRDQPIRVRSWLNEIQLKFPAYGKVYAEVKKGYVAVIGASVIATVERPMGPPVDLELRDDGIGADVTDNDGIYSGYFTHFNGNGRYAVIARVTNDGQARLKHGSSASASLPIPVSKSDTKDVPPSEEFLPVNFAPSEKNKTDEDDDEMFTEPASKFDRSANGGSLRVESFIPNAIDMIPPGDISDLTVDSVKTDDENGNQVVLQFTVPGDDLDDGQISSLELRASRNAEELITNFADALRIDEAFIIHGLLLPAPREKVSLVVKVPDALYEEGTDTWTVYFAVKAKDEAGNTSPKCNVAAATFGFDTTRMGTEPTKTMVTEMTELTEPEKIDSTEEDQSTEKNEETSVKPDIVVPSRTSGIKAEEPAESDPGNNSFKWWPVVIGIGIAITVIMIVVLIAVIIIKKTRMKTYFSVQNEQC